MILVAGSANLDFVVRAPRIPSPGETVLGREFQTFPGGKGANQAIACARAGDAVTQMLLALGQDAFAAPIEDSLRSAAVRTHVVRVDNLATGIAFICVADDAENAITVASGANNALHASHLPSLDDCSHLLLQLEIPMDTVIAYAAAARRRGVKVVLNAAPARTLAPGLLAHIDVLIVNESELAEVSAGSGDLEARLAGVDVPCIVVTLGARGSCARSGLEWITQPAFAIDAVDTTAAGDTYCGVLVAALSKNLGMGEAMQHAGAASALACTRPGAQSSIPTHAEVQGFLQRHRSAGGASI
jgi:ribokinase